MKIKEGFMLRQVGEQTIVVAVGSASRDFNGIIRLNSVGKFLWEALSEGAEADELATKLSGTYDVDEATAKADVLEFIDKLKGADLLA
ncbi:MAG: PqqD family protein [Ruminococcus sp.]|nr:PqqD family protein [Ruminococcus sp.]